MSLKFCNHTENKSLTILLVGNECIIQLLSESILQANDEGKLISNLKVHTCETVQQVISSGRPCAHVDYIAFCIDSRSPKIVKKIEEEFDCLSKTFLIGRVCLILAMFGSISSSDTNMVINLRTKYQLHQINGKMIDENGRLHLSTRLLRLVSFSCGLHTGYPAVENFKTIPANEDEESESDISTSILSSDGESEIY